MFGRGLQLAQGSLRFARLRLAQRKLGLGLDACQRRAQLVRGIGNETLLRGEHRAEPCQQVIHRMDQRPHFIGRLFLGQGGEVAVRAVFDFLSQVDERRKPPPHAVPHRQRGGQDQQALRQDHAQDDLPRRIGARSDALGDLDQHGALACSRLHRHPQGDGADSPVAVFVIVVADPIRSQIRRRRQVGFTGDEFIVRTGDEVIEAVGLAGLQHLQGDVREVDVDTVVDDLDLSADIERGFEQRAIICEIHETLGDVVVDDGADRPQDQQRSRKPGDELAAQSPSLAHCPVFRAGSPGRGWCGSSRPRVQASCAGGGHRLRSRWRRLPRPTRRVARRAALY